MWEMNVVCKGWKNIYTQESRKRFREKFIKKNIFTFFSSRIRGGWKKIHSAWFKWIKNLNLLLSLSWHFYIITRFSFICVWVSSSSSSRKQKKSRSWKALNLQTACFLYAKIWNDFGARWVYALFYEDLLYNFTSRSLPIFLSPSPPLRCNDVIAFFFCILLLPKMFV